MKKFKAAKNCCKNVKSQLEKLKITDSELQQGTWEVWQGACKALGDSSQDINGELESEDDDGLETISEDSALKDEQANSDVEMSWVMRNF